MQDLYNGLSKGDFRITHLIFYRCVFLWLKGLFGANRGNPLDVNYFAQLQSCQKLTDF